MPVAILYRILRIAATFVITFLAYRFLNIIFDLIKSHITQKSRLNNTDAKKPEIEVIETEFVENIDEGNEDKE